MKFDVFVVRYAILTVLEILVYFGGIPPFVSRVLRRLRSRRSRYLRSAGSQLHSRRGCCWRCHIGMLISTKRCCHGRHLSILRLLGIYRGARNLSYRWRIRIVAFRCIFCRFYICHICLIKIDGFWLSNPNVFEFSFDYYCCSYSSRHH